jgi:hypothetical protein
MHIIFGKDNEIDSKYTLLELDTFYFNSIDQVQTAYCVIDNVPINDLPKLQSMKKLHADLMENYKKQDWNYCLQAIEHLMGSWGHELDTFYNELLNRIEKYSKKDPESAWSSIIVK